MDTHSKQQSDSAAVSTREGLLLVGHGTRSKEGQREFRSLGEQVQRKLAHVEVETVFLELAEPDVLTGFRRLHEGRIRRITVVPVLLFPAGHALRDLPELIDRAQRVYSFERVSQAATLSCHPRIVEQSLQRFTAVNPTHSEEEIVHILVGRGSSDANIRSHLQQFATACRQHETNALAQVGEQRIAFLAMASPLLEEVVREVGQLPHRNILVQPHLLFQGDLLSKVGETVKKANCRYQHQNWLQTAHLGANEAVADALVVRFLQAGVV